MRYLLAALLTLVTTVSSWAEDADGPTELTKLMTAYDVRGWEAVGRLNIGWSGMCTGALIAPNLVLTAGHCLHSTRGGEQVDPTTIEFLAGWRNGQASAKRRVRRAVIHPEYVYSGPDGNNTVQFDLALLELEADIRLPHIQPFPTGKRPRKGASVGVVSYARNRSDAPSIQKVCHVLARRSGTLILSCDVDFGASGAPIFAEVDGKPQIVSVVSAMADIGGRQVSLGTNLTKPLALLKDMLAKGQTVTGGSAPIASAKQQKPNAPRVLRSGSGGAKFLRP